MATKTPDSIGKYKIIAALAQGGMGAVYTAQHPTLDRTVIIKKLTLRGNAGIRERFRREAQIMMDLRNDAIVNVYDHFREGSYYYIVLEYVDGFSLDQLIRNRRYLPEKVALMILREACRGLAYAHSRSVIHRDIKPANILISKEGDVKIVDFGIATIHGDDGSESELTREGMTLGTPSYMAPEQFQNTRSVDRRADIYSLGVVLYEMLTGKRPYPGSFTPEVIVRIQRGRYLSPRKINPKVSFFAATLIRKMLHPKLRRRFSDLERVIRRVTRRIGVKHYATSRDEIRRYLEEETSVPLVNRVRRRLTAFAGVLVVALGLGVAWGVHNGYHFETFSADQYGAVEPTVRVLKDGRSAEELAPEGVLYYDDGEEIPPVPNGTLHFQPVFEDETPRFYVYRAERMLLPAGAYRAKLVQNGSVQWSSFQLPPLSETQSQRITLPGRWENGYPLAAEFASRVDLPLDVTILVRDARTGRRLESGIEIAILRDDRWRPFTFLERRLLRSGTVHRFRITHAAYEPQVFSLAITAEQSSLVLDVGLEPKE